MSSTATKSSASKKTTKAAAAAAAAPAVAAPAAVVAPAKAAAPAKAVETPAVAAPVADAAVAAPAVAAEEVNIVKEFNTLVEQVNALRTSLATVFSTMKKLEKQIPRELKKAQKGRRRRAAPVEGVEGAPKKESVFTKPTPISEALCTFLGVAKGSSLSRSEVTTKVCTYAKTHNLMDKQVIRADAALRKLLALTEKDELKILNLQRYLKPHYIKA